VRISKDKVRISRAKGLIRQGMAGFDEPEFQMYSQVREN